MADRLEDHVTESHSQILAHDYNLAPNVTKCERTLRVGEDVCSMFLANTSGTVRCLVKYHLDANTVAGVLRPPADGVFLCAADHNGKSYFQRADEAWLIWWDGVDTWNISTALGVQGDDYWTRTDPAIEGDYVPQGTAEGTPTVEPPNF